MPLKQRFNFKHNKKKAVNKGTYIKQFFSSNETLYEKGMLKYKTIFFPS